MEKNSIKNEAKTYRETKKVMGFLKSTLGQSGETPSLRDMAKILAISHAAVAQTLKLLETKGYIRRLGRYSRNVVILDETGATDADHRKKIVPIVGRITAGLPIYATQEWEGSLVVDDIMIQGKVIGIIRSAQVMEGE